MNEKFRKLHALGAGDFEHIDGNLIDHLEGTKALLKSWQASSALQDAGLYHAAYGTAGFNASLVSTKQRSDIAAIIGPEAEEIVYLYCACDREYFWPQIGVVEVPKYKDRFNGEIFELTENQLRDFCELTVANELEIAKDNPVFTKEYGSSLRSIFINMRLYLTSQAFFHVNTVLNTNDV